MHDHMVGDASANNAAVAAAAAPGFTMSPTSHAFPSHHMHSMGGAPFNPPYSYGSGSSITNAGPGMINEASGGYDVVFGTVPTNALGSPAAWHGGDRHNKMQLNQVRPGAASPVREATTVAPERAKVKGRIHCYVVPGNLLKMRLDYNKGVEVILTFPIVVQYSILE